jgi:membrane-associated phospholipid phosphatase
MSWLQTADTAVFRFINQTLSNPVFDLLMPLLAGVVWFVPVVAALGIYFVWKGGLRGRLFVTMLALLILLGDTLVINQIKKAVGRERPSNALADARVSPSVGKGGSESMPSSHASTWAAAALIAFAYYPRSRRFMVPMAGLMAFSRVYLGVHYPSDAIAGLILGAGYAAFGLWTLNAIWQWAGPKWFPDWSRLVPCLVVREDVHFAIPSSAGLNAASASATQITDRQYLTLGYVIIAALLVFRLIYVASDKIELSETEAYQWLWSKHLALSYHGAPPGIAFLHFISNQLWGDTHLGVRFFPPILAAVLSVAVMRFFAREAGGQAALALMLALTATPLFAAGSILMTSSTPLVLFWTLSMLAGWRAVQPDAANAPWYSCSTIAPSSFSRAGHFSLFCRRRRGRVYAVRDRGWVWG